MGNANVYPVQANAVSRPRRRSMYASQMLSSLSKSGTLAIRLLAATCAERLSGPLPHRRAAVPAQARDRPPDARRGLPAWQGLQPHARVRRSGGPACAQSAPGACQLGDPRSCPAISLKVRRTLLNICSRSRKRLGSRREQCCGQLSATSGQLWSSPGSPGGEVSDARGSGEIGYSSAILRLFRAAGITMPATQRVRVARSPTPWGYRKA